MNLRKFFLYLLIVSVVSSALIGIGVILFREFGELETRIILTTFTIACASMLGLACGANLEAGRGRVLPMAGIAFSILSAVLCMALIWWREPDQYSLAKFTGTAMMFAFACALLSLVGLARLDARFRWSYYLLATAVTILVAILTYILWLEPPSEGDLVARLIGVLSIVIAALTIMTPVFHKLSHKVVATEEIDIKIARLRAEIEELERQKERIGNAAI